jgi:hypothetical protein
MPEGITKEQKALMGLLFQRTGRTYQDLAHEAGILYIPTHMIDLSYSQAAAILSYYEHILED